LQVERTDASLSSIRSGLRLKRPTRATTHGAPRSAAASAVLLPAQSRRKGAMRVRGVYPPRVRNPQGGPLGRSGAWTPGSQNAQAGHPAKDEKTLFRPQGRSASRLRFRTETKWRWSLSPHPTILPPIAQFDHKLRPQKEQKAAGHIDDYCRNLWGYRKLM
jgi:hypothetical protein